MKQAFDVDGVLATAPPPSPKKWGLMKGPERVARRAQLWTHYERARVLFRPTGAFWAISARKEETRPVTEAWLKKKFPKFKGVFLLTGPRTTERVVAFKVAVLKKLKATEFTEDNLKVIRAVARSLPGCSCYYFDGKQRTKL